MTLRERLKTLQTAITEYSGLPTYTERFQGDEEPELCVIFLSDESPWEIIPRAKSAAMFYMVETRHDLDNLSRQADENYLESDAEQKHLDLITYLIDNPIPGGFSFIHISTSKSMDAEKRYIIQTKLKTNTVEV